jgi:hypothetical protein
MRFPKDKRIVLKGAAYVNLKKYVYERDNYLCVFCGTYNSPSPAHVIRKSKIRIDAPYNMVTACLVGPNGLKGCHQMYDDGEIELPEHVKEMLAKEPERIKER